MIALHRGPGLRDHLSPNLEPLPPIVSVDPMPPPAEPFMTAFSTTLQSRFTGSP